jgi:hypothetical protein
VTAPGLVTRSREHRSIEEEGHRYGSNEHEGACVPRCG